MRIRGLWRRLVSLGCSCSSMILVVRYGEVGFTFGVQVETISGGKWSLFGTGRSHPETWT